MAVAGIGGGSAQAATLTLGPPLTGGNPTGFGGASGLINTAFAGGASAASPVDGTVVSWQAFGLDGNASLQVVRPTGPDTFVGVNTTPHAAIQFPGALTPPQPAGLAIQKGDYLSLSIAVSPMNTDIWEVAAPGGGENYFDPPLSPGASQTLANPDPNLNYMFAGTIRYCVVPKLRGKTVKRAKAALAAADCTFGKVKKKKGRKARKKIKKQSVPPGTSISDTAPVNVKLPPKPAN